MDVLNLTDEARKGKLPPLQADPRRGILNQILAELEREEVFCLILVGEPGVGKRTLFQLLAWQLVQAACPSRLKGTNVWHASPESLVPSPEKVRFLQNRLFAVGLLDGGASTPIVCIPDVVRFFEQGVSSTDLGKWLLNPGNKWLLSATTEKYQKYIAANHFWDRREFVHLVVAELSKEDTRKIALQRREWLQAIYAVALEPPAIEKAVELSAKFLARDRRPWSVIRVLEKACEKVTQKRDGKTVTKRDIASVVSELSGVTVEEEEEPRPEKVSSRDLPAARQPPPEPVQQAPFSGSQLPPVSEPKAAGLTESAPPPAVPDPVRQLMEFVEELERRAACVGAIDVKAISFTEAFKTGDPQMLAPVLDRLLSFVDSRKVAAASRQGVAPTVLEELRCFVGRVNQFVLHTIFQYDRGFLDQKDRLPRERPWDAVLPKDAVESADPEKIRRYLRMLIGWVEEIHASASIATAEMFSDLRKELQPQPKECADRYLKLFHYTMERDELLDRWQEKIKNRLRQIAKEIGKEGH